MTASNLAEPFAARPPLALVRGMGTAEPRTEGTRRTLNVLVALVGIVIAAPVMALVAVLIKLTSPGPVFFAQTRVGLDRRDPGDRGNGRRLLDLGGKPFRIYKFRTMYVQKKAEQVWASQHDPRVTSVGRVLRKYRLDELPQLFNVLTGSMSLIGPRPTLPDQVAAYDEFRRLRLRLRPGITGLAQVNGHALASWEERILYDLAYVRRCGFWMDQGILLRTLLVMLLGEERTTRPFASTKYAKYVTPPPGYGVD